MPRAPARAGPGALPARMNRRPWPPARAATCVPLRLALEERSCGVVRLLPQLEDFLPGELADDPSGAAINDGVDVAAGLSGLLDDQPHVRVVRRFCGRRGLYRLDLAVGAPRR